MLRAFGATVQVEDKDNVRLIRLSGDQALSGTHVRAPGDPSSAAFAIVAALITPGSEVTVEGVMLNPLRAGVFSTLQDMGADLTIANLREDSGEPVGDLTARYSALKGVTVPPERAPAMIDEYPILAVAAAFATGTTIRRGIG
jgi:3-phosphoshikimate 1-carboxyvinyltransferase